MLRTVVLTFAVCLGTVVLPTRAFSAESNASPAKTQPRREVPDSPAGRRFDGWLGAFNGQDHAALTKFHTSSVARARIPAEQRIEMQFQASQFTGGLNITAVRPTSETAIEIDAETKLTGDLVMIHIEVEPETPHGVTDFSMRMSPKPRDTAGEMTEAQIAAALGAHLDRLVAADAFSGVVIIARNGKPFFARACGAADREREIPSGLDTKFSLASVGKMFTAVAVVRLADQGKLSLDDTVGKHLPRYPNRRTAETITIRQLLTHTSGMGDIFGGKWVDRPLRGSTEEQLAMIAEDDLAFEPGTQWQYSNAGYVLLGAIIEKVTERNYFDAIASEVFEPAGMRDSGFFATEDDVTNRAIAYSRMQADGTLSPDKTLQAVQLDRGGPAGGAWSTAEDLLRFSEALRTHVLVKPESLAAMTSPQAATGMGPGAAYGYGFEIQEVNGQRIYGHYGGYRGVSTGVETYPKQGYTVIILSNSDFGGQRVIGRLHEWLGRD